MSISSAMQTGVSGLLANSKRVGTISDNIANANTDGYRRSFSSFVTSVAGSAGSMSTGVQAVQGADVAREGALQSTGRQTDLAIDGEGFFVVSRNPDEPLESNYMLTRAGSFVPDERGNLKNKAGYYLAGFPIDASGALGVVDRNSFGDLSTVNVADVSMNGDATTRMDVKGNLPSQESGVATPGDPFMSSAEFYNPLGDSARMQFAWQPTATPSQWTLTISDDSGTSFGNVTVDFHDSGPNAGSPRLYSGVTSTATAPAAFAFDTATGTATVTINNGATPQSIDIGFGAPDEFTGMTQFAGDYSPLDVTADGARTGTLVRAEFTDRGDVYGFFDNGARVPLFRIPVAMMNNPNAMMQTDGNAYRPTRESGSLRLADPGAGNAGVISSGVLEASNVEITQELTDLIKTQRAYSSNAKIVTTVDEMLDETMRLKR